MNGWNTVLTIVRREYLTRVRRRAFMVATVLGPILTVGLIAGLVLLTQSTEDPVKVWVVDHDGLITVQRTGINSCRRVQHVTGAAFVDLPVWQGRENQGGAASRGIHLHGDVRRRADAKRENAVAAVVAAAGPGQARHGTRLQRSVGALEGAGAGGFGLRRLPVAQDRRVLGGARHRDREQKGEERALLGFMFSVFMFTFVLIYGMHVMRGVIEEKSNRIVEVVLSTVRPSQLLAGKIAGIGLVGLTQILGWAVLSWGLFFVFGLALDQSAWMEGWAQTQGLAPKPWT